MYLVEVSRNKTKVFCLIFQDYTTPVKFMGQSIPEKIASKIIHDLEYDYGKFVGTFFIKFEKLQIEAYHGMNKAHNYLRCSITAPISPVATTPVPQEKPQIEQPIESELEEETERELTDIEMAMIKLKKSRTSFKSVMQNWGQQSDFKEQSTAGEDEAVA